MKFSLSLLFSALALGVSATPAGTPDFRQKCSALSSKLTGKALGVEAIVQPAEFVKAGTTLLFPNNDPTCTRPSRLVTVDLCRVSLNITTSPRSGIRMEAWLPLNWNGRFLSTGNGGLGGCISYEDVEYAASFGFASVGANGGHDGMTGQSFTEIEVIKDYSYRSVHTGTVVGKKISKVFYGKDHKTSYYLGCSTGGRQGFKSVQKYPADFDGVIAGAPAFSFNNLTSWSSGFYPITGKSTSPGFVTQDLWFKIAADVLDQCDTIDGVADRIIEDPDKCHYDFNRLACTNETTTGCLKPAQVETIRTILSDKIDPTDGSLVYPRPQPGAEIIGSIVMYNGLPFGSSDWFKYAIKNDPNWDPITLNANDWHESQDRNLADVQTWSGDLSAFKKSGGKVLHYHGLMDGIITSDNSPRYYDHVSKTMNLSPKQLDSFYRYFRVSGMGHCNGGNGAVNIGNQRATYAGTAPEDNVLFATVKWVEQGIAPEFIRGTAYVNGNSSLGIDYQRNHCKWPARNTYKGTGDPKALDSWICK